MTEYTVFKDGEEIAKVIDSPFEVVSTNNDGIKEIANGELFSVVGESQEDTGLALGESWEQASDGEIINHLKAVAKVNDWGIVPQSELSDVSEE